ncbi:MAG: O-antigen/teichoic acid export membrane protein [Marivirga sp.]|jgi:O-antigen/teichoic acid export membrane protein
MKDLIKKYGNHKVVLIVDQAMFSGVNFLLTLVIARLFSPALFGMYAALLIALYFVLNFLTAFIIQPLQVIISKEENQENYVLFNFSLLLVIVGVIGAIAFFSFIVLHLEFIEQSYLVPTLLFFSLFLVHDFFRKVLLARANIHKAFVIDLLYVVTLAVFIAYAYVMQVAFEQFLFMIGLSYLPAIVYGLSLLTVSQLKISLWTKYFRQHVKHGRYLVLSAAVQWWSSNLFVVSSGIFLGVEALGAFRLVQSLFGILNIFLQTLENYFLPNVTRIYAVSAEQATKYLNQLSLKSIAVFSIILSILFIWASPILEFSVGSAYLPYAYVVKGMVILYAVIIAAYPVRMAIRMLLLNRDYLFGYVLSLLFSLLSFNYLLSHYQLAGALLGLIGSQVILLTFWYFRLSKNNFQLWKSFI